MGGGDSARAQPGPSPPRQDDPTGPEAVRRVLLVGFMGSGKTTVGRALAGRLSWTFHDFDRVIEERAGMTVRQIFEDHGEARFRALEAEVGRALLRRSEAVLATGGGWPAAPGRMTRLPPGTLAVWLQVEPATAVARARAEGATRPLLEVDDPVARARALLQERAAAYARAAIWLDTQDAQVETLVDHLERRVHGSVGDGPPGGETAGRGRGAPDEGSGA